MLCNMTILMHKIGASKAYVLNMRLSVSHLQSHESNNFNSLTKISFKPKFSFSVMVSVYMYAWEYTYTYIFHKIYHNYFDSLNSFIYCLYKCSLLLYSVFHHNYVYVYKLKHMKNWYSIEYANDEALSQSVKRDEVNSPYIRLARDV